MDPEFTLAQPAQDVSGMKEIPQIPFYVRIIGPTHRGKTVMLNNLLSDKPGMYGSVFKKTNIVDSFI